MLKPAYPLVMLPATVICDSVNIVEMKAVKKTYQWVPSLYLMQSIPFCLVSGVAPILYKNFNYSNIKITFLTSLFAIPWFCKPLFAPFFETFTSKRNVVVATQIVIAGLILLLAASLYLPNSIVLSGSLFMMLAIASSIHDMNSDGLYILSLDAKTQAHFIGVRTLSYQIGRLLIQGGLIFLVGYCISEFGLHHVWQINLTVLAFTVGLIAIYHTKSLPYSDAPNIDIIKNKTPIKTIFKDLAALPYLTATLVFVLCFNMPESALIKIVPLFLLDHPNQGGAGLTTELAGSIFGGIGIAGMLLGVFISGLLVAKFSLKKTLLPITIFTASTTIVYLLLSLYHLQSVSVISLSIFIAELGFGLSNGAYMLFLLHVFGKGRYPMSQYAIGVSLMCLGATFAGAMSGYLQYLLGYTYFFLAILAASVFMILLTFTVCQSTLCDRYEIN